MDRPNAFGITLTMPAFHLALRTRRGAGPHRDVWVGTNVLVPTALTTPTWMALAHGDASPAGFTARHQAAIHSWTSPPAVLRALDPEACLSVHLDPATLTVTCAGSAGVLHFFRLADGAVKPLPPEPAPMTLAPGDVYLALTPGAACVVDSPAIARFIHLRDYFNADRLAAALLDHLAEIVGSGSFPEDITVLVAEVR